MESCLEEDAWAVELGCRVGLEAWVDPQTCLTWGREAETRRADGSSDQWGKHAAHSYQENLDTGCSLDYHKASGTEWLINIE